MKASLLGLILVAGLALTAGAQTTPLVASHQPVVVPVGVPLVARVNGVGLTQRDLQREVQKLFPYAGVHGNRVPGAYQTDLNQKALAQIVFDELVHQEALRRKMAVPRETFVDVLQQAKGRFPTQQEYEAYATQEYGSVKGFENQIRRALLIALLLDKEIAQKARVSTVELQRFYEENKSRFLKPESVWIQSISLNVPSGATASQRAYVRKRAEDLLPQARTTRTFAEFGQLAERFSEDDWRIMLGDHKWVHRGRLPNAVENVAFRMKEGEISDVLETSQAFVIIRINGRQPQRRTPFSEVRDALREDLEKAKQKDRRTQFEQQLRRTFKVEQP